MHRVLLVDDENLLLDSQEIILSFNNMEVIGKANDGRAALKILDNLNEACDIALVDLNMKGMGGGRGVLYEFDCLSDRFFR